jgi:hypothetical protein
MQHGDWELSFNGGFAFHHGRQYTQRLRAQTFVSMLTTWDPLSASPRPTNLPATCRLYDFHGSNGEESECERKACVGRGRVMAIVQG